MSLVIPTREVDSAAAGFVAGPYYGGSGEQVKVGRSDGEAGEREGYASGAETADESCESSSIGTPEDSSVSLSEGEEVESKARGGAAFGSMDSLDDALPFKRGLSNFFNGKSKSFAALSDVVTQPMTAGDLAKPEHPFNKRRRILMANRSRWPRRASCGSLNNAGTIALTLNSAKLFSLEEDEEEEDKAGDTTQSPSPSSPSSSQSPCPSPSGLGNLPPLHGRRLKYASTNNFSFRSARSFSLGDLQQHPDLSPTDE